MLVILAVTLLAYVYVSVLAFGCVVLVVHMWWPAAALLLVAITLFTLRVFKGLAEMWQKYNRH